MTIETILEQARVTPSEQLPEFLGKLETARAVAYSRLQAPAPSARSQDELIDVNAAAGRLSVSRGFLFRNDKTLPFTRRVGRRLLFSSVGITEYISQKGATKR